MTVQSQPVWSRDIVPPRIVHVNVPIEFSIAAGGNVASSARTSARVSVYRKTPSGKPAGCATVGIRRFRVVTAERAERPRPADDRDRGRGDDTDCDERELHRANGASRALEATALRRDATTT